MKTIIERDHLGHEIRHIIFEDLGAAQIGEGYLSRYRVDGRWVTTRYAGSIDARKRLDSEIAALRQEGVTGSLWLDDGQIARHSDPLQEAAPPSAWEEICA